MDRRDEPEPPDLTLSLPRDTYYQIVHTLHDSLPPPATETEEDLARRDNAAIAHVASLLPANAEEAHIAAQHVAATAQAMECLRLARQFRPDDSFSVKCRAQAASMMREARGARTLLLRVQAARRKLEADSAAADRAAWSEHCTIGLMAQALSRPAPAPMAEPQPPVSPAPSPAPDDEPMFDPVAAVEKYVMHYPQRAALIRRLGRLPDKLTFGPRPTAGRTRCSSASARYG